MLYLGCVIAAFLGGVLITAYWLTKQKTLRKRFDGLGTTKGKAYTDIVAAVGASPQTAQREANGQVLRTWQEKEYSISLLFDGCDICLGVMDEQG